MESSRSVETPVGMLTVVAGQRGLAAVLWPNERPGRVAELPQSPATVDLDAAVVAVEAYFAGSPPAPVVLEARGTEFQRQVWQQLQQIPWGQTRTYMEIAVAVGRPSAARAVGAAVGRNPWSILVPCHRVVGADGALTGFAGGLSTKRWLLRHEGASVAQLGLFRPCG